MQQKKYSFNYLIFNDDFIKRRILINPATHPVGVSVSEQTIPLNRPGFPGECFICELRLPDHRFRWKHNKLFLLLPEEYGPA
ncbi:hypothetical protein ACP80Z_25045, partial [Escherichia coli]